MRAGALTARAVALLAAGSVGIHQLRYAIAYGDGAAGALAAHPHGYLHVAIPFVLMALLIGFAAALMRVARGSEVARGSAVARASAPMAAAQRAPLVTLWIAAAVALAAMYGAQESLEGAGAVAGGGWIGLARALPAGLLVALALRGAHAAEHRSATGVPLRFALVGGSFASIAAHTPARSFWNQAPGARAPPLCPVA